MTAGASAGRLGRATAITAAAQLTAMAIGGVLAALIVVRFGKGARTDGLFSAYGVYAIVVLVAQSMRVALVARLVDAPSLDAGMDRYLAALLPAGVVLIGLGVGLGHPAARVLVGGQDQAVDTASAALALLAPAAGAQLLAALAAAGLATRDSFVAAALAYVAGGLLSLSLLLGLSGPLGLDAVPVGILAGSVLTALIIFAALVRGGYRPSLRRVRPDGSAFRALATIGLGAVGSALWQLGYVISTACAARIATGAVTTYAYAFFAASLLAGVGAGSATIVLAAPLSRAWAGDPATLREPLRALARATATLAAPLLGIAAVTGAVLVHAVLPRSFSGADGASLIGTLLALTGVVVAAGVSPVPALAAFADARYAAVAAAAAGGLTVQAALSLIALATDRVWLLGLAASIAALATAALVVRIVLRSQTRDAVADLAVDGARLAGLTVLTFAPLGVAAAAVGGVGWAVLAAAAGTVLWVAGLRALLPEHWALLARVLPVRRSAPAVPPG